MLDLSIITILVTFKEIRYYFQNDILGCPWCVVLYMWASSSCWAAQHPLRPCGRDWQLTRGHDWIPPSSHLPPPSSLALNGKRRLEKIRKVECSREDTTKIFQKGVDGFRPAKKGGEWPSQVLATYSSQLRWQCGWGSWEPSKPGNKVPTGQWQQGESNGWDEGTEKIKPWSSSH